MLLVGWLLQACHPLFLTEEVVPAVPSQQTTKDNGELYWMLIKYFIELSPYLEFCWLHTHTQNSDFGWQEYQKFLAVAIFKHSFALNDWNFTWLHTHSTPFCYSSALSDAVLPYIYICMLWWLYNITLLMNEPLNAWRILHWLQIN